MQNTDDSFADRLNRLFEEKTRSNGMRYTKKEVLDSIPVLTRVYLWRLQTDKVARPNYEIVKALADFFGVHPSYFFEEADREENSIKGDQREELQVMLRSFGLDKNEQKAVLLMIELLKKSKG